MKLLLDTHLLLWALQDAPQLSRRARMLISDPGNEILYSAASLWEVQIKHDAHPDRVIVDARGLARYCGLAGYRSLPIAERHVLQLPTLVRAEGAAPHKDPFDRIMICQAKADGLVLLTHDSLLGGYGEPCVLAV